MIQPYRIGASTMFLSDRPVREALETIACLGYAAAEVWMGHLVNLDEDPAALARQGRELGLTLTTHAFSRDINPTSVNRGIAAESRRQIALSLETTEKLGAEILVVHPGRLSTVRETPEIYWRRLEEWLPTLDDTAERLGITVGLELMECQPGQVLVGPADAVRLMAGDWRRLALTVDLAHLNTCGDPVTILRAFDPTWVAHVHLSDNAPAKTHLPLGQGQIDLPAVLQELGGWFRGLMVLEGAGRGGADGDGEALLAHNMAYLRAIGIVD